MSKIDTLISQLCPDGVKRVRLGEVCQSIKTGKLNANAQVENGEYPFFTCDAEPYKINTWAFDTEAILVSGNGSQVGHINYYKGKFNAYQRTYVLSNFVDEANIFYLLHLFKAYLKGYILDNSKKGSIPYITLPMIENFEIPLPPLPIQAEIVKILDRFAVLTAELEAELEGRRKQYEYYRTRLLSFDSSSDTNAVRWMRLGEVCLDLYSGATPSTGIKEYWENGTIPWMSSGEVNFGQIYEVEKRITQLGYDKCSTKMVPKESVVIALAGQGKTRGMVALTHVDLCTNQSLCALIPNKKLVIPQYLFQYLKTQYRKLREVSSGDGTRGGLNLTILRSYQIQVPSLSEQERIVNILDKFDQLVNGVKDSIPALIDDVQKQYEFYRNKLLTFPE